MQSTRELQPQVVYSPRLFSESQNSCLECKSNPETFHYSVAEKLSRCNVTEEDLKPHAWFAHSFQVKALAYLLIVKKLSVTNALNEIEGLSPSEAKAITQGLTREDVLDLPKSKIKALVALKSWKLTRHHLDQLEPYSKIHTQALIYLMKTNYLTADAAVQALQNLGDQELSELRLEVMLRLQPSPESWTSLKNDVNNLNEEQLDLVKDRHLRIEDVTGLTTLQLNARKIFLHVRSINEKIRSPLWSSAIKDSEDLNNLASLFHHGMDFDKALKSLAELNKHQSSVVVRLHWSGEVVDQLRQDPGFDSEEHEMALDRLLSHDYTAENALNMIKGKTAEEVSSLGQRGCLVM